MKNKVYKLDVTPLLGNDEIAKDIAKDMNFQSQLLEDMAVEKKLRPSSFSLSLLSYSALISKQAGFINRENFLAACAYMWDNSILVSENEQINKTLN